MSACEQNVSPELRRARERCEQLEEENRQLHEALTPPRSLRLGVRLSPGEDCMLRTLLARSPNVVTRDALLLATRRHDRSTKGEPAIKTVDVWIFRIRRKLTRVAPVTIANHWGVGYSLDRESAERLRALAGERAI